MNETFDKELALRLLRERGIARVELTFSGGGDEGGVDDSEYLTADGTKVELVERAWRRTTYDPTHRKYVDEGWWVRTDEGTRPATEAERADAELIEACEASVYERYGSFAGEFEVEGKVLFDVVEGTVVMECQEGSMAWSDASQDY